jgi:hypothetical protein
VARRFRANNFGLWGRGRTGSGFGQRQVLEEEYHRAASEFGSSFVDAHLEAIREGRTKMSLTDLLKQKQAKKK